MPTPKTLDKYPAEFFSAWELAKKNKLALSFPTRSLATSLRQRLYAFRKLLAAQQGPAEGAKLYNVDLLIEQQNGQWLLRSWVPEWKQQLRAAEGSSGMHALSLSSAPPPSIEELADALAPASPVETAGQEELSAALSSLGFASGKE